MPTEPKTEKAEPKKKPARAPTPRVKKVKASAEVSETKTVLVSTKENTIATIGRRKTAIARVKLIRGGSGAIQVNGKPFKVYFPTFELQRLVLEPLRAVSVEGSFDMSVVANGGGIHSQAEAVRLGVARGLIKEQPDYRTVLKKLGFLTRDPRAKERKKPGLRRARRAPQWSKR